MERLSATAIKWGYGGTAVRIVLQIAIGIALARILGPRPFGVYATVLLITTIASVVVEGGISTNLIHIRQLSPDTVRSAFSRLILRSLVGAALIIAFSHFGAWFFDEAQLKGAILGGAFYLVFYAAGSVSGALLRRELNMRVFHNCHNASYLLAYGGVGLAAAVTGFHSWALILALAAQPMLFSIFSYASTRHPVQFGLSHHTREFDSYSTKIMRTNIVNWFIENFDNVIAAKVFGMLGVGLYSAMYNLVRVPANHAITTLQQVLFSASARIQEDMPAVRRAYLATVGGAMLMTGPVFFGIAATAGTFVDAVYGDKWQGAELLLTPLALAMAAHAAITGSVILWATDKVERELRVQSIVLVLLIIGNIVAAQVSLTVLAWVVFVIYLVRATLLIRAILQVLELSWRRYADAVRAPLLVSISVFMCLSSVDHVLVTIGVPAAQRLSINAFVGAFAMFAATFLLRKLFDPELRRCAFEAYSRAKVARVDRAGH